MHRIDYCTLPGDTWKNFCKACTDEIRKKRGFQAWLIDALAEHNAVDVFYTNYIEFETEEDFVFFKLKYA